MKSYLKRHSVKTATLIIAMSMLLCLLSVMSFAADWPQWHGPNRDGISSETGWSSSWPEGGPKQAWKLSIGVGYSSVAVSDGRVYAMGNTDKTDTVYCLDANTGSEIWKHSYSCAAEGNGYPGPASTPTVDGGSVYTLSRDGHVHCLNAESGDVVWSKHVMEDFGANIPNWGFSASPLVMGKMLVLDVGMALALNKDTGELIWKTKDYGDSYRDEIKTQGGGYSSAVAFSLNGSQALAVFNSTGLIILDPKNGQELMMYPWKTAYNINAATPIISGDEVFIASGYNVGGVLLKISDGKLTEIWKSEETRNQLNSSVLWEGHLYGFDEKELKCLDWKTGEVKWTQKGLGKGSLMLADGKLIALGEKGTLVIAEASPASFNELASAKVLEGLCWTVPVLSNGKIYCLNHEGDLVCLDVKP